MARIPKIDFETFIERRQKQQVNDSETDYSYAADRQMRQVFSRFAPIEHAISATVRIWKTIGRSQLLGSAVAVSERQFPRLHALNVRAASTLGIPVPALFVGSNPTINAGTYGTNDDSFILINSALIDHFSDEEILSVIGHECGHIQNNHVLYNTVLHFLTGVVNALAGWFVAPAITALRAWSQRSAEVTSDRAGLLVVKDLDISVRSLVKLALGSQKLYEQLDIEAFLDQYKEGKTAAGRFVELTATHPYVPKRIAALRVFAETSLYRARIGQSGGVSLAECDSKVNDIVRVMS